MPTKIPVEEEAYQEYVESCQVRGIRAKSWFEWEREMATKRTRFFRCEDGSVGQETLPPETNKEPTVEELQKTVNDLTGALTEATRILSNQMNPNITITVANSSANRKKGANLLKDAFEKLSKDRMSGTYQ